ncbi:MAG: hypothetical protein COW11_01340 [Candidatus Omnitrophica bacterium CG12_big_fil_rev_8_21_14_0_65_43_15]|uniref:ATPase domain-containing protein n=1 Tax=Candidatus Taenaricola geysiri TaxID=1974752 RepID=A0A2J0LG70_9BACT|nr:MAG: hypothetical protein AUJ89_02690 [Candidatus Omnitrophica bacterium CG1_02_43_210]PIR66148.1 MAG: hypothetical protein COU52_00335 [Candidatus Omnitrophica bacterium CG10_big_fil_rev_8_21_14_0_10_43_8]PIV12415.1 MAG: hypothetical protein COS48_00720 [Candidatus Omnitrophica bacterium CG03_land_8_20_14_0_80_43_22]PIW66831.1 MAG: hypothetical protein COW11_01340 [Candidatus Omnitrophica bacterium CG12_big_fil_rev_8_21_14_0_65_43_15]PIW80430.1 MAG: hypothetical protein COZ98_02525 [Candida
MLTRLKEKNLLIERLKAFNSGFRQNVAVLGKPFIGKTFLIRDLLKDIYSENIAYVYVEARHEPLGLFAHRFIGSLLYRYLVLKNVKPQKDDLVLLIKDSRRRLPKTAEAIEKIERNINKKNYDAAYELLLDLPEIFYSDSGIRCAVILEEFDQLSEYKVSSPFSALGKKIMAQRNTFYIVTSSSPRQARFILSEKLQLLFGNFETVNLEEFNFSDSREFILSKLEGFDISDQYTSLIINFTDGHPLYLRVICEKVRSLLDAQKKTRVTAAILEAALDEALFNPSGELYQHFINIVNTHCANKNGVDVLSMLTLISQHKGRMKQLSQSLAGSAKSIKSAVSDMQAAGLVEKIGVFNKIDDSAFRFWLKSVYYKRRMDFTADPLHTRKVFMHNLKKASLDFMRSCKDDLYEKTVDLFKAFRDDLVDLENKKYILPRFSEVSTRVIGENGPYIISHSKGKNWICQIREREVTDKHVADFLKDAKASKFRFHRKILIVTEGMDDNAKLMAKSSGVWIWNLKTFNLLLDLYGKYKLVRL